ncbi:MAG: AAA family ATPase [Bacteroidales bacterium]|nr:AAA family ATPase [Bacteroidales bacterium]
MTRTEFIHQMYALFPYEPTKGQAELIDALTAFLYLRDQNSLFLLKGYAGTGKTTIVSLLVRLFKLLGKKTLLMAPTGRAAKVLSAYARAPAFTIHKQIYQLQSTAGGGIQLFLAENKHRNTLFIIDEASMIPDESTSIDSHSFGGRRLLDDLMEFTYSGNNCRMILLGDDAQLPPVGLDISPALDLNYLKSNYHQQILHFELKDVVRQAEDSGILSNATTIRNNLDTEGISRLINHHQFNDVSAITGEMLEEYLQESFSGKDAEDSIIVTRSNKRANVFNQEVRKRILLRENEIAAGDLLMIVKNNYFWVPKNSKIGFLANGDLIEIMRIEGYEELYGYRFASVNVRLIDYPDENDISIKILLDTLQIDGPSLSSNETSGFMDEVMKDYEDIPTRRQKIEKVKNNPWFNAVQVKFGYALTCHKTQGGQWDNVFIDLGYLNEEFIDRSFYRWLYTAFTRARKKIYLINFPERFFT